MKINPFENHPDNPVLEKKSNNYLTLDSIHGTIMNKMVEVRNESQPHSAHAAAILLELLFELEEKCQNN